MNLWGCGFNQFGQINDSGEDVYNLTLIDYAQSSSFPSIKLLWAGWADLLCASRIDIKLIKDSINKDERNSHTRDFGPFEYRYRGGVYNGKDIQELRRLNDSSQRPYLLDGFGNDALLGINEKLSSGSLLLQKDGNHMVLKDIQGIAVAGNGYAAYIPKDRNKVYVFSSLEALHPDSMQPPIFTITVPRSTRLKQFSEPISRLVAGDAHFSFIVTHFLEPEPGVEYYHNIWSIRTDSRSTNDAGWIPLEEELSTIEDTSFVTIETSGKGQEMAIMCANADELVDFVECKSAGWITAAISDDKRAWIFPFGRAISTIPDLPVGEVKGLKNVMKLGVGSHHIVAVTGGYSSENEGDSVWTFGLNDHGQRGIVNCEQNPIEGWRRLELGEKVRVLDLVCGKWSTYLVVEREISK